MLIINGKVFLEDRVIENGFVSILNDKIVGLGEMGNAPKDEVVIDAKGKNVMPGFIDQHIHGANGADHMDATQEALKDIATFLPAEGTTSYLATTMTQSVEAVNKALDEIEKYRTTSNGPGQAEILGVHLEGPFISKKHVGAQNPNFVAKPTKETFDVFWEASHHTIKIITYAPEEAEEGFTDYLRSKAVVPSIGHSDSYFEEVVNEIPHGLANMTHFHNAMTPHHHRNPGAVTAGFIHPELKAELIVDGIHLNKNVVKATYEIKGADNIILITDAMRAKGLPDGKYDLGGQEVTKIGKECRIENGALAGSVAEMNFAVSNFVKFTNAPLTDVVKVASYNPARQIGVLDRKGSLAIGKDADVIIIDDEINVLTTITRGVIAYQK